MKLSLLTLPLLAVGTLACGSDGSDGVAAPDTLPGAGAPTSDPVTDPTSDTEPDTDTDTDTDETSDSMIEITGNITYLQRIALRPGSTATITLEDVSLADAASTVITEQVIELGDQQVPIPFELTADGDDLDERFTYSVRATITGPDGALAWTTDTTNPIDPTQPSTDVGDLVLVQVADPGTDGGSASAAALSGSWTVTEIDGAATLTDARPTLQFGGDSQLSGSTSCNSYGATYVIDGDELTVSDAIMTQMFCASPINEQESAFMSVLSETMTFQLVDANTQLVLEAPDGRTITASR